MANRPFSYSLPPPRRRDAARESHDVALADPSGGVRDRAVHRRAALGLGLALAGFSGCADPVEPVDPELPSITDEEWALLATLRYDDGAPPPDPSNVVADDPLARALGQRLFFERAFSGPLIGMDNDGTLPTLGRQGEAGRVSCADCHVPESGFTDTRSHHRQISLGSQWTDRRSPTLLEIAFAPLYNWDGRRDTLWNQSIGVMESDVEFNSGRLFVAQQVFLLYRNDYEAIAAFGALPALDDEATFPPLAPAEAGCEIIVGGMTCRGKPGDGADYDNMSGEAQEAVTRVMVNAAKAIGAYLRLLRCGESRFDAWLDGDVTALSASEQRGAQLFVGRAGCVACHSGPNLTDGRFHNVGLRPGPVATAFTDLGDRGAIVGIAEALEDPLSSAGPYSDGDRGVLPSSVTAELDGAFRTPTLRCTDFAPSYMHTGQYRELDEVVRFFDIGGYPDGYPGVSEIAPLGLTEEERTDLVAFLESLTGPGPDPSLLVEP